MTDNKRRAHTWLNDEQKAEVVRRFKAGERPEKLAVDFNVHFNTIRNIVRADAKGS